MSLQPPLRHSPGGTISARLSTWLDALRWIAAATVVQCHLRSLFLSDYDSQTHTSLPLKAYYFLTGFHHEAVIVFFVLSGFLIGGEVTSALQNVRFNWTRYLLRRATRLYVPYAVALLLTYVLDLIGQTFSPGIGLYQGALICPALGYTIIERHEALILLGNGLFLQTIAVPTFGSNQPLWSMANEVWYYLLLPLFAWPIFARGIRLLPRLVAVMLALAATWITWGEILFWFPVWLMGLAPLFLRLRLRPLPALVIVLGTLLIIRLGVILKSSTWTSDMLLATALALLLGALNSHPSPKDPTPALARIHRFLAGFSYSLYLVHWPLVLCLAALLSEAGLPIIRQAPHWFHIPMLAGFTIVAYLVSFGMARLTEHHTPAIRSRLAKAVGVSAA